MMILSQGVKKMDDEIKKCTCETGEREEHSCPFQDEIHGNEDENYCKCCPYCTQQCRDDI